ncbi:MAG: hypothetical protein Q4G43_10270 [Mobilicoccus sp.]|nr:hypothetical protein [Mobilicoccus sp.]
MPTLSPALTPRAAAHDMIQRYAARHGLTLTPTTVTLRSGAVVRVDGSDGLTHVQAHTAAAPVRHVDLALLVQDVFALALLRSAHPDARTLLLVRDEAVRDAVLTRIADTPAAAAVEVVTE